MEKKYSVTLRKDVTCREGANVLALIDAAGGKEVEVQNAVLVPKVRGNKFGAFLGQQARENLFGMLVSFRDEDGEEMTSDKIEDVLDDAQTKMFLTERQGQNMLGYIIVSKDEKAVRAKKGEYPESLTELVRDKVRDGILTKKEADERIGYMKKNGVDAFLAERVVKDWRLYKGKAGHKPSCLYNDPFLSDSRKRKSEGIIAEGLRAACDRHAIILEGEKSVGKNIYAETITWLMCMPMYLVTFSRQMSPSSIYGEKTTDNTAADLLSAFDSTWLRKAKDVREKHRMGLVSSIAKKVLAAMKIKAVMPEEELTEEEELALRKEAEFEKLKAEASAVHITVDQSELYDWLTIGGVMVFNEMNMAEANFFASFTNQLLDGTGFLNIPGRGEVDIDPNCVLFGTQNADYQGVEIQNEATMSRFGCLYFKQPRTVKPQLMTAVSSALKKCGYEDCMLDEIYFDQCEAFYKQCQKAVESGLVANSVLNIRGFVRALTAVAKSNGCAKLRRQVEIHVINTCPVDDRAQLNIAADSLITM